MVKKDSNLPTRDQLPLEFQWNLIELYQSLDAWNQDFAEVKSLSKQLLNFKGKLQENSVTLLNCLQKHDHLAALLDKVYVYAKMKRDENNNLAESQELAQKADSLLTEVISSTSFIMPELIMIPKETLDLFLDENLDLSLYRHHIQEILRQKSHILSEKEERLLGMAHDISTVPRNTFLMYNNADLKFPHIKDENGNRVELTKGRYVTFLESTNREVRKNAFEAVYDTYSKHKNTLASTLTGSVQCAKFYAIARNYEGALESSLDNDHINPQVYHNLIDVVNQNLHLLHRYLDLRKKVMNLPELHMYDLYTPLFQTPSKDIPYSDATNLLKDGLASLGPSYIDLLEKAFSNGWIDVYENVGKTSGAYSWGAYLSHPYVLLNYQGKLNDVFTLAHEMGHALHSYYTNQNQPYIYSEYKIFVAEVASTVNESLLTKYLLEQSKSKEEKGYILNHFLEEFRGTIFRQVMFAEFEREIHHRALEGEPLGSKDLSDLYYELNVKYYGKSVVIDPEISMEWARIPHFYNSFYVYKYATGLSSALSISKQILEEGSPAVERYMNFLKSGGSDYPLVLLKQAGVDLLTPKPLNDAFKTFEDHLKQLEECLNA
jgi:oligoendopeptidase F